MSPDALARRIAAIERACGKVSAPPNHHKRIPSLVSLSSLSRLSPSLPLSRARALSLAPSLSRPLSRALSLAPSLSRPLARFSLSRPLLLASLSRALALSLSLSCACTNTCTDCPPQLFSIVHLSAFSMHSLLSSRCGSLRASCVSKDTWIWLQMPRRPTSVSWQRYLSTRTYLHTRPPWRLFCCSSRGASLLLLLPLLLRPLLHPLLRPLPRPLLRPVLRPVLLFRIGVITDVRTERLYIISSLACHPWKAPRHLVSRSQHHRGCSTDYEMYLSWERPPKKRKRRMLPSEGVRSGRGHGRVRGGGGRGGGGEEGSLRETNGGGGGICVRINRAAFACASTGRRRDTFSSHSRRA